MPRVSLSTTPVTGPALHSPPAVTLTGNRVADDRSSHAYATAQPPSQIGLGS